MRTAEPTGEQNYLTQILKLKVTDDICKLHVEFRLNAGGAMNETWKHHLKFPHILNLKPI